jgi:hypothetical protein
VRRNQRLTGHPFPCSFAGIPISLGKVKGSAARGPQAQICRQAAVSGCDAREGPGTKVLITLHITYGTLRSLQILVWPPEYAVM